MEEDNQYPEWYKEKLKDNPKFNYRNIECGSMEEFCGRFDLTREKAAWEIKRCKLWGYFTSPTTAGFPGVVRFICGKTPHEIPLQEFDRYSAIIAAEKQEAEPTSPHPNFYMRKRHPAYSSELEAVVSCWEALFADAPPGKVETHTKAKAIDWLKKNRPQLDAAKRERLATVLTPDSKKTGGAPPTPK